jgi:O-antigen/teichoic acid export membrane protein
MCLLLPLVFLGIVSAERFVIVVFGDEFRPAAPSLQVLVVASVALILLDCGQGLLAVLGQRRAMFISSFVATAIAIVTLLLMVPTWGAFGAAVSSLIAYGTLAILSWVILFRVLRNE